METADGMRCVTRRWLNPSCLQVLSLVTRLRFEELLRARIPTRSLLQYPPMKASDTQTDFGCALQRRMAELAPQPSRWHSEESHQRKAHVPTRLLTCTAVYEELPRKLASLRPKFSGPHPVLQRGAKTFLIKKNGRQALSSVDRLKPA